LVLVFVSDMQIDIWCWCYCRIWISIFDGKDWIPSKVDMNVVRKSDLSKNIKLSAMFYNIEGNVATAVEFLFPADWQFSNISEPELIDKDNPIGSILPFAGNKESIPVGWMLCDGRFLLTDGNEALFNVLGYRWGKNDNNEFALPNLQGQFLRGVDYSKRIDPDVNDRINSLKEVGEVGSYQSDAFQIHIHNIGKGKTDKSANSQNKKRFADFTSNNDGPEKTSTPGTKEGLKDPSLSTETRPKNYYVNFIIRIK